MSIKERITQDLKDAMKAREKTRLGVLRMLKARMLEAEVEQRGTKGPDYQLGDSEALSAIASYAKQRKDSIESYRQAGRADLVAQEEAELAVVQGYLPKQLSADEIRAMAKEAVAECGAQGPKDMGGVMKVLMPRLKGAADGKLVNEIVRSLLL